MRINRKIKTLNQLIPIAQNLKKQNKKIVTTNGVFDILHLGHVKYLEDANKLGDVLIVGVNSNKSAKQNKGDKTADIEMGRNAGCKTILVLAGHGTTAKDEAKTDFFSKNLL